jgi:hypothetical protein
MQVFEMPADSFKMFDFGFAYDREEFSDRTLKLVVKASGKSPILLKRDARPCLSFRSILCDMASKNVTSVHSLLHHKLFRFPALSEHVACS